MESLSLSSILIHQSLCLSLQKRIGGYLYTYSSLISLVPKAHTPSCACTLSINAAHRHLFTLCFNQIKTQLQTLKTCTCSHSCSLFSATLASLVPEFSKIVLIRFHSKVTYELIRIKVLLFQVCSYETRNVILPFSCPVITTTQEWRVRM